MKLPIREVHRNCLSNYKFVSWWLHCKVSVVLTSNSVEFIQILYVFLICWNIYRLLIDQFHNGLQLKYFNMCILVSLDGLALKQGFVWVADMKTRWPRFTKMHMKKSLNRRALWSGVFFPTMWLLIVRLSVDGFLECLPYLALLNTWYTWVIQTSVTSVVSFESYIEQSYELS